MKALSEMSLNITSEKISDHFVQNFAQTKFRLQGFKPSSRARSAPQSR